MTKVRLGYVGCGFMAQKVHLHNFTAIESCEVVALAEVRQSLGPQVQALFGIPKLYDHHLAMAEDPDIDAFAVSAAFAVQGDIACDLLKTGKPVFMEKPMAVSVAQAERIVEASRASNAGLMVGYMKRYDAGNELVKETVDQFRRTGELGNLTFARAHGFCGDWICGLDTPMVRSDEPVPQAEAQMPDWLPEDFYQPYLGYLQQYTHNINLLRYFLNAGDRMQIRTVDLDEDGHSGIVSFDVAGVHAVLESGRLRYRQWDEHTQIYFDDGWVQTWAPPLLHKNLPAEVEIYLGGETHSIARPFPKDRWSWSYRRQAEHFVNGVQTGDPFRSTGEDTLTDVRLFEEIYQAYLKGRGVI